MDILKRRLKTDISLKEITVIENWWDKLSDENKKELEAYYLDENKVQDNIVSIYLCGKFVEQDRQQKASDVFWINHFYDFIINHELHIDDHHPVVGGICSSNDLAEQAIRNGLFHAAYSCPLKKEACLIEDILKKKVGKSLELYLKFKVEAES